MAVKGSFEKKGSGKSDNEMAQALGNENMDFRDDYDDVDDRRRGGGPRDQDDDGKFSWLRGGINSTIRISSGYGANLTELIKQIDELSKRLPKEINPICIPIECDPTLGVRASTLVICLPQPGREDVVAFHPLVLACSLGELTPAMFRVDGYEYRVERFASDAITDELHDVIDQAVNRRFPNAEVLLGTTPTVVPKDVDLTEDKIVMEMVYNSLEACRERIDNNAQIEGTIEPLNLAKVQDDCIYRQTVVYGEGVLTDVFGNPIRADVTTNLIAVPRSVNRRRDDYYDKDPSMDGGDVTLSRMTGYVDFIWNTNRTVQNRFRPQSRNGWGRQDIDTAFYQAMFVITHSQHMRIQTVPATLMSLLSVAYMVDNNNWVNTKMPHHNLKSDIARMHDIGNLFWDIDIDGEDDYAYLDTKPDKFSLYDLDQLMQVICRPGLIVAQAFVEHGPYAWQYADLIEAANGDRDACNIILDAANNLTDGHFDNHYEGSNQPISSDDNIFYAGYYPDENGDKRDVRDVDMTFITGQFGPQGERDVIGQWIDTFNDLDMDPERRLAIRAQIEANILGGQLTYTNRGIRGIWEPAFMEALFEGAKDAGLVVQPETPYSTTTGVRRANGNYDSVMGGSGRSFYRGRTSGRGGRTRRRSFHGRR